MQTSGEILVEARHRHGLSQQRLAIRASTTQSRISRIERGQVSPSVDLLRELLYLMGEDLVVDVRPREFDVDRIALRERLALTPAERVERGIEAATRLLASGYLPDKGE
jgi:transcriptional regulator with XRE-family HTH domain